MYAKFCIIIISARGALQGDRVKLLLSLIVSWQVFSTLETLFSTLMTPPLFCPTLKLGNGYYMEIALSGRVPLIDSLCSA